MHYPMSIVVHIRDGLVFVDLISGRRCIEKDPLGLCRRPVQVSLEKGLQVESGDHDVVEQPEVRPDRRAHLLPHVGVQRRPERGHGQLRGIPTAVLSAAVVPTGNY